MRTPTMGARAFIPMALAGAVLFTLAPAAAGTANAASPKTEAEQIVKIAKAQRGDPWRYGATGPRSFDCSGLVLYAYRKAGDGAVLKNGRLRTAGAMYRYYKARGKVSRSNPKLGDIVVWGYGSRITHVGIYVGKGKAISTLTSGVRIHGVRAVTAPFKGYIHTGMNTKLTAAGKAAKAQAAAAAAAEAAARVEATRVVTVGDTVSATGSVALRSAPAATATVLATVANASPLAVLGTAQDAIGGWWLKVQNGTTVGWVSRSATA